MPKTKSDLFENTNEEAPCKDPWKNFQAQATFSVILERREGQQEQ